jgi:L-lactate dehydrogenase complex protein LldG
MSSRSEIFGAIQALEKREIAHPGDFKGYKATLDVVGDFKNSLSIVGAICIEAENKQNATNRLSEIYPNLLRYTSQEVVSNGLDLQAVDVLEIDGMFGVAENGAIWLSDQFLPNRVAPFICQHLVIYVAKSEVVATLHEAYERLDGNYADFGLFLSGPSKTADIEQSLVIGAHGARSLTIVLI